ncbi:hypothetical protein [Streptomyces sp. S.PNR 29]|uniref:hypothetical protein n=1 Tax=Streptomyces sp. S.PNR 29 TaxID=2973805 RepID=UPI0025AFD13E|nr:hypothetical protein [Streptomyces sp. S.PNR 29]MDN0201139.1 hypothetical protein [Streptomyces sp. S.PNR 29]
MNVTPQVETAEMSDGDLDKVSGGLAGAGAGNLSLETPLGDLCADLLAAGSAEGLVADGHLHAGTH